MPFSSSIFPFNIIRVLVGLKWKKIFTKSKKYGEFSLSNFFQTIFISLETNSITSSLAKILIKILTVEIILSL